MYKPEDIEFYDAILGDIYLKLTKCRSFPRLIFKGGFTLRNLLNAESMMTKDIDISMTSEEVLELFLSDIGAVLKSSRGLSYYDITYKETPNGGKIKMKCKISIKGIIKELSTGIDFNIENHSVTVINYNGINMYSPYAMLVDKFTAMSSISTMQRRLKDLTDIFIIMNALGENFSVINFLKELNMKRPNTIILNPIKEKEGDYNIIYNSLNNFILNNNLSMKAVDVLQVYSNSVGIITCNM